MRSKDPTHSYNQHTSQHSQSQSKYNNMSSQHHQSINASTTNHPVPIKSKHGQNNQNINTNNTTKTDHNTVTHQNHTKPVNNKM